MPCYSHRKGLYSETCETGEACKACEESPGTTRPHPELLSRAELRAALTESFKKGLTGLKLLSEHGQFIRTYIILDTLINL